LTISELLYNLLCNVYISYAVLFLEKKNQNSSEKNPSPLPAFQIFPPEADLKRHSRQRWPGFFAGPRSHCGYAFQLYFSFDSKPLPGEIRQNMVACVVGRALASG